MTMDTLQAAIERVVGKPFTEEDSQRYMAEAMSKLEYVKDDDRVVCDRLELAAIMRWRTMMLWMTVELGQRAQSGDKSTLFWLMHSVNELKSVEWALAVAIVGPHAVFTESPTLGFKRLGDQLVIVDK